MLDPVKRVALITGSNHGLGALISSTLLQDGVTVITADTHESSPLQGQRLEREGRNRARLDLDVSNDLQAEEAVRQTVAAYGRLDILINNVRVDSWQMRDEFSIDDWDRLVSFDLRSPFVVAKHALTFMKQRGRGHIVNIAAILPDRFWPNTPAYYASKWGLLGLSHALSAEAAEHNIKVSAVIGGSTRGSFVLEQFTDVESTIFNDPQRLARVLCSYVQHDDPIDVPGQPLEALLASLPPAPDPAPRAS